MTEFVTPDRGTVSTRTVAPWRRDIIAYWFALRHRGEAEREIAWRNIRDAQWIRRRLS